MKIISIWGTYWHLLPDSWGPPHFLSPSHRPWKSTLRHRRCGRERGPVWRLSGLGVSVLEMPADHAGRESVSRGGENALGPGGSTERRRQVWAGGGLCAWSLARCCPGQVSSLGPRDGALRAGRRQERPRGSARAPCSLKTDAAWPVGRQHPEGPSASGGAVRTGARSAPFSLLVTVVPIPFSCPSGPSAVVVPRTGPAWTVNGPGRAPRRSRRERADTRH